MPRPRKGRRRAAPASLSPSDLYRARVKYAKDRILRVLRVRIAAYRRELERQVCEVGFDYRTAAPYERTEPHHLTDAIRQLKAEEAIREVPLKYQNTNYVFWALSGVREETVRSVLDRKGKSLAVFQKVEHTPSISGHHAEYVHHLALNHPSTKGAWKSVGWKAGAKIHGLGAFALERPGDVDLAGYHLPTGRPFVVQVKNGREWLYPPDDAVWDLLGAAAQLQAVPILVARRVPDRMFDFMKIVGGFAFRSVHMILHPDIERSVPIPGMPSFTEAVREFGFHTDIDYTIEPLPHHLSLWTGSLGAQIEEVHERFLEITDDIMDLAYGEDLRNDKRRKGKASGEDRKVLTDDFADRIRERHRQAALEAYREAHPLLEDIGAEDEEGDYL